MGASVGTQKGPVADINVTPLIDVVLVLLVVFMVITPMLESGKPVELPAATQAVKDRDVGQFIVVSITQDDGVWVMQQKVEVDGVVDAVSDELKIRAQAEKIVNNQTDEPPTEGAQTPATGGGILIKADRKLTYRVVREVLDKLGDANLTTVQLATSKEQ